MFTCIAKGYNAKNELYCIINENGNIICVKGFLFPTQIKQFLTQPKEPPITCQGYIAKRTYELSNHRIRLEFSHVI